MRYLIYSIPLLAAFMIACGGSQSPAGADAAGAQLPGVAGAEAPQVKGTLSITSRPNGELVIDGEDTGVSTPAENYELAPGRYTLQIRFEGSGRLSPERIINVRSDVNSPIFIRERPAADDAAEAGEEEPCGCDGHGDAAHEGADEGHCAAHDGDEPCGCAAHGCEGCESCAAHDGDEPCDCGAHEGHEHCPHCAAHDAEAADGDDEEPCGCGAGAEDESEGDDSGDDEAAE